MSQLELLTAPSHEEYLTVESRQDETSDHDHDEKDSIQAGKVSKLAHWITTSWFSSRHFHFSFDFAEKSLQRAAKRISTSCVSIFDRNYFVLLPMKSVFQ